MQQDVVPFDLVRMFFGDDPALFYLEIVVRILIVYVYALALIRWVGGRGIAQMSTVEFLLVIALGSAVGDSMFYPEVPILQALLVITGVVVINKVLDVLIFRSPVVEQIVDGATAEVVRDGVLDISTLRTQKLGQSELFEGMREAGFTNLGQLRCGYMETSGRFSFFAANEPAPGLPIEPAWSVDKPPVFGPGETLDKPGACCTCGALTDNSLTPERCANCGATSWTPASCVPKGTPGR